MKNLNYSYFRLLFLFLFSIQVLSFYSCAKDEVALEVEDDIVNITGSEDVACNSAYIKGNITSNTVDELGICWDVSESPTKDGFSLSIVNKTGAFNIKIENLNIETKYYLRSYSITNNNISYGAGITITTSNCSGFTLAGKSYNAVQIGNQCWMQRNLEYGSLIPGIQNQLNNNVVEKYAYADNSAVLPLVGALYQWKEAMEYSNASSLNPSGVQGLAPKGWHLPSDDEWKQLELHLGMSSNDVNSTGWRGTIGDSLKSNTGFNVQYSGFRLLNGSYADADQNCYAYYWAASEQTTYDGWYRAIDKYTKQISRGFGDKNYGMSIRFIKD